ncbi:MAG: photosynthetic complex putative assembly protein PuhB [Acidocella sp.]|nr:photosynthetic complex putative assembly protein PuhB [Acidocella sp.]
MSRFKGKLNDGLPEKLPAGEQILWQGAPNWRSLARRAFRINIVGIYFAALIIWRIGGSLIAGHTTGYALTSGLSSIALGTTVIGIFCMLSWLMTRSTTYTITNRRVVITYGIALPKSVNLPFSRIDAADYRLHAESTGDIALKLPPATRLSYLLLWPHVHSGSGGNTEPVLRCIEKPAQVAEILVNGLGSSIANNERATLITQPAPVDLADIRAQAA